MARKPYIGPGEHKVMCDICGLVRYASQTVFNWKGERVCKECWEPRHPQEMPFKIRKENNAAPNARPWKEIDLPSQTEWPTNP